MNAWAATAIGIAAIGLILAHLDQRAAWRAREAAHRQRALMKELEKH